MNEKTREAIRNALLVEPGPIRETMAIIGRPDEARMFVCAVLDEHRIPYVVIDTSEIPSQEEMQNYRRSVATIRPGQSHIPTIVSTFMALTNTSQLPRVLIFANWNKAGSEQTYFTKVFLDPTKHHLDQAALEPLRFTVVLMDTPGNEGTVPIDRALRGCLQFVIENA